VEATIPVHPKLRAMLEGKGPGKGYVFPGRFPDQPSTSARIWHWVRAVADDAGVLAVAPHRLRHSCIASALDNTRDLRGAQDLARHADPSSTAIYTRTTKRRLVQVVEALDY
jgi:integrase/recombinase XerD